MTSNQNPRYIYVIFYSNWGHYESLTNPVLSEMIIMTVSWRLLTFPAITADSNQIPFVFFPLSVSSALLPHAAAEEKSASRGGHSGEGRLDDAATFAPSIEPATPPHHPQPPPPLHRHLTCSTKRPLHSSSHGTGRAAQMTTGKERS